jgi:prevent-host-death family protein
MHVRAISITSIRQDATRLLNEVNVTHEPLLVLNKSRPAAYVLGVEDFEQMQRELRQLRHDLFWHETDEARAEYRRGEARSYLSADELISDLGLELGRRTRTRQPAKRTSRKRTMA